MSLDEDLYELLGEQSEHVDAFVPPDWRWDAARRETATRMLDATAGVLAATGRLIAVAEELVRDQRDRLACEPPTAGDTDPRRRPDDRAAPGRRRIDLSY
ncbi:MAG TPA: hypothetical protein VFB74_20060 [Kribbellaceae bacterium]|nr:hypothetical protein [Kribbellaceae bacterium]